jgi:putative thioredoxin
MSSIAEHVVDVTDATFEQVVIQGSMEHPVVVDMWADWCAPCRTLGPILEKVATERAGAFTLAKLDVDANAVGNALLQAVRSQGIPTVVAFKGGEPVDMFIGAYPEDEVNRFIDSLVPSESELVAEEAHAEEVAGDLEGAEEGYRAALETDPANRDAVLGLARILVDRDENDAALELVTPLLPDSGADRIVSAVRVKGWRDETGDDALARGKASAFRGDYDVALTTLLEAFSMDKEAAREAMVDVFNVLGPEDPLVSRYRQRLAAALY